MPGVLIEETGGAIVWYAQFPTDGSPPQARYRMLYGNEALFRDSAPLRKSEKLTMEKPFLGDREIGGAAEPGAVGFWIIHHYTDSSGSKLEAVGKVEPGCGTLGLCGQTCTDLSTDEVNCGKCGTTCGTGKACQSGTCKGAPQPPSCEKCKCPDGTVTDACLGSQACGHACVVHEHRQE